MTMKFFLPAFMILFPFTVQANSFDTTMKEILGEYLPIQEALASDSIEGVTEHAGRIAALAGKLSVKEAPAEHRDHYKNLPAKLKNGAAALAKAESIESIREKFKDVSRPMSMWAQMSGAGEAHAYYCSMAKSSWVQKGSETRNPFYGKSMLKCGEKLKPMSMENDKGKMHHHGNGG